MNFFVRRMQIFRPNLIVYWHEMYWRCPECFEMWTWKADNPLVCLRCWGAMWL